MFSMVKRSITIILTGIIMLGLLTGCLSASNSSTNVSVNDKIIGTWIFKPYENSTDERDEDRKKDQYTVSFFSDGTMLCDFSGMSKDEWKYLSKECVYRFTNGQYHNHRYVKITFSGDKMIMTPYGYYENEEHRGSPQEFIRVQAH